MFRITLGDFDVTLMNDSNPVLGPIFFFLFVFFVYFILLCMFLAIITYAYFKVKEISGKLGYELTLSRYLFMVISFTTVLLKIVIVHVAAAAADDDKDDAMKIS